MAMAAAGAQAPASVLPEFVAASSTGVLVAGTTAVVDVPTGTTDGDLMVCMLAGGGLAPAFGGTWNTLASGADAAFGWRIGWRRASSEPSSYTMTNFGTQASAVIGTYRNADDPTGFAIGATSDFSGTSVTFPAGASAGDGLWVCFGALRSVLPWTAGPAGHDVRVMGGGHANRSIHLSDVEFNGTPGTTTAEAGGLVLVRPARFCIPRS